MSGAVMFIKWITAQWDVGPCHEATSSCKEDKADFHRNLQSKKCTQIDKPREPICNFNNYTQIALKSACNLLISPLNNKP